MPPVAQAGSHAGFAEVLGRVEAHAELVAQQKWIFYDSVIHRSWLANFAAEQNPRKQRPPAGVGAPRTISSGTISILKHQIDDELKFDEKRRSMMERLSTILAQAEDLVARTKASRLDLVNSQQVASLLGEYGSRNHQSQRVGPASGPTRTPASSFSS
jgi:hypothetical protein